MSSYSLFQGGLYQLLKCLVLGGVDINVTYMSENMGRFGGNVLIGYFLFIYLSLLFHFSQINYNICILVQAECLHKQSQLSGHYKWCHFLFLFLSFCSFCFSPRSKLSTILKFCLGSNVPKILGFHTKNYLGTPPFTHTI